MYIHIYIVVRTRIQETATGKYSQSFQSNAASSTRFLSNLKSKEHDSSKRKHQLRSANVQQRID